MTGGKRIPSLARPRNAATRRGNPSIRPFLIDDVLEDVRQQARCGYRQQQMIGSLALLRRATLRNQPKGKTRGEQQLLIGKPRQRLSSAFQARRCMASNGVGEGDAGRGWLNPDVTHSLIATASSHASSR